MSYAYTDDLMEGTWTYGENGFGDDVIQDNHGRYRRNAEGEMELTDLETICTGNDSNHGGVVKVNGKWYVFGHINTSNGARQGIAEQIELKVDGDQLLIDATEQTSSGLADNLDAYQVWDAGIACYRTPASTVKATGYLGNHGKNETPEIDFDVAHYAPMQGLVDGAVIGYKYLDFGDESVKTNLKVLVMQEAEGYADGTMDVYIGAPSTEDGGTKIGSIAITADAISTSTSKETGTDGTEWTWLNADMETAVSGEHGVYFVFSSESEDQICKLDQFGFTKLSGSQEPEEPMEPSEYRACEHTYSYELQEDSYEATDTTGGYRHYKCSECGKEYSYKTDPMVYVDGFKKQDGTVVEVNEDNSGSVNPNLPLWEHIPDAEPHVFWSRDDLEWRVYMYGSHDNTSVCGDDHVVWSAPVYDLSEWRWEGEIIRVEAMQPGGPGGGPGGDFPGGETEGDVQTMAADSGERMGGGSLFAPDCDYDLSTDNYVLMTFENGQRCAMYLGDSPVARFDADEEQHVYDFPTGFGSTEGPVEKYCTDPAIYIEDDGTIYVMGNIQKGCATEEVQTAMTEAGDSQTAIIHKVLRNENGEFYVAESSYMPTSDGQIYFSMFEGLSIRKDDATGTYIVVYCNNEYTDATGTGTTSAGLAYAYAKDPMGTWTYGDNGMDGADIYEDLPAKGGGNRGNVIYENGGRHEVNPATGEMEYHDYFTYQDGNDHGGIERINGKWYIFGHRQSGNGNGGRQNTIQKIELNYEEDGSLVIPVVEMTSSGAADNLNAFETWDAGITCYLVPGLKESPSRANGPYVVNWLGNNDPDTNDNIDWDAAHYSPIVNITAGSIAGYKYLDFGNESVKTNLKVLVMQEADGYTNGTMDVYIDAPSTENGGTKIGSIAITADAISASTSKETGTDGTVWTWLNADMDEEVSGEHGVYFVFSAESEDQICKLDQFGFTKLSSGSTGGGTSTTTRYTITVTQSEGGKISPSTTSVTKGSDKTFTITADDGYKISDVLVDGKSVGAVSSYTFENVTAKHTITAKFEKTEDVTNVGGFIDVKTSDWFADAVEYVVNEGLMNGTSETTFSPNGATTRGMIVTILYRQAGSPEVESDKATWWSDARTWAMSNGVSDGTNMDQEITREQLATMLYRYAKLIGEDVSKTTSLDGFKDGGKVSSYAVAALKWAAAEGVITGKTGGVIDPQAGATRAETATMLMRFCGLSK